jgi:hypothetical protein
VSNQPSPDLVRWRRRVASAHQGARTRPLDDPTTELVRVIPFVWTVGRRIQAVLLVERELLN